MSAAENLRQFELDFYFEDYTDGDYIEEVVGEVLKDRYEGVDTIEIDEMGGTTHFVYFVAEGRKLPKTVLDLPPDEQKGRKYALFHLMTSDY